MARNHWPYRKGVNNLAEYEQKTSLSFYLRDTLRRKIIDRAEKLAIKAGWNGKIGKEKKGLRPNISGTITDLLEIGFFIIEHLGENWRDKLASYSEPPPWAKSYFDKYSLELSRLSISSVEIQETNENDENEIDISDMLE